MITPVILSGGSGTRLWPLSTPQQPKQFLALTGNQSLFQQTLDRVSDRTQFTAPVVVANASHEELCLSALSSLDDAHLILEPVAKNTAAAIVMAAEEVRRSRGPDAMILVMPSDHLIGEPDELHAAVVVGTRAAEIGRLVTFGIRPTGPETGYGYLEAGQYLDNARGAREVARFTEKPDHDRAEAMLASGSHFWNGGIFLFRVADFLAEAERLAAEIHRCAAEAIRSATRRGVCIYPRLDALQPCPSLSIDYAVMEHSDRIAMVAMDAEWSDVGSWDAVAELGTASTNRDLVHAVGSRNCYVRSDRLKVGLLGVDDLVVVASGDHVLVMRKGHSQHIRQLVAEVGADR